jgi:hypothetical protein
MDFTEASWIAFAILTAVSAVLATSSSGDFGPWGQTGHQAGIHLGRDQGLHFSHRRDTRWLQTPARLSFTDEF